MVTLDKAGNGGIGGEHRVRRDQRRGQAGGDDRFALDDDERPAFADQAARMVERQSDIGHQRTIFAGAGQQSLAPAG